MTQQLNNNIGGLLHCVSKQIQRAEHEAAITALLATATESENVKPDHCAQRRIENLEKGVFELFAQVLHLYRADELMIAFNGGKDCTVLLHLIYTYFKRNKCISHVRLPVLYIEPDNGFEEVEAVVLDCERRYNMNLIRRKGCIKDVLVEVLEEMPELKAVFMGTRRTDPYSENLSIMQATDVGWPSLMRISPLIDWTYTDIWYYTFVRQVPYCRLYENGYTSLGQKHDTIPNPHLRIFDPVTKAVTYKHAADLHDEKYERAGRGSPTLRSATERLRAIDTTVKMHAAKHNSHDDLQDNMPTGQMTSASSFCSSVSSILTTNSSPSGTPTSSSSTSTISASQHGAIATELPNNQCRTPLKSCSMSSPVSVNI